MNCHPSKSDCALHARQERTLAGVPGRIVRQRLKPATGGVGSRVLGNPSHPGVLKLGVPSLERIAAVAIVLE